MQHMQGLNERETRRRRLLWTDNIKEDIPRPELTSRGALDLIKENGDLLFRTHHWDQKLMMVTIKASPHKLMVNFEEVTGKENWRPKT